MSYLELHGPGGTIQTVKLPKSGSLLIGSDAVCDVQILDPEVQPIHARLKIQSGKNLVEATPEGKSVKINGKRVAQGSIGQGDELVLGKFRIVLSETAATSAPAAPKPVTSKPTESKTASASKKNEPLELDWDDIAEPVQSQPIAKRASKPSKSVQGRILAEDVAESVAKPPAVTEQPRPSLLNRLLGKTQEATPVVTVSADAGRGLTVFAEDETTGRKLATAPLILLLSLTLVVLSVTAFGLWWIIDRTRANRAYESGIALYDAGDFRTSSERLQSFLRMRPNEDRSSNARVLESLSRVRELAEGSSPQLSAALTLASKELPPLADEPAWKDRQMDAAEIVATMTRDLAARAKQTASAETVDQARSAYRLHTELAGEAAEAQRTRLKVDQVMAEAEAAVAKGEFRTRTLTAMDEALKQKDTLSAFRARDTLLASYPELISDTTLIKRLESANQQVKDNVKLIKLNREAQTEAPQQTLGPPATLFTRIGPEAPEQAEKAFDVSQVIVTSGAGLLVALDRTTGQVLWQNPSGAEAGFEPLMIPEETPPSVLTYDDRDQALVRVSIQDGKTIWRQALGDTPNQQPLLLGNRLLVALPEKGQILWIDLGTGAVRDGLDLQWPLAGSIVASFNNQTLYVPADQSVLFVIQVEPKACLRSVYIGHLPGTMRVRPVRSGRFLIFPEKRGLKTGMLQTWLLDDRGAAPQRLQQEPLDGWPIFPPGQQGNLIWVPHDRGGFSIFSIGDYTLAKPLSAVGKSPAIDAPAHATAVIAVGQRESLVVDRTLKHYRLDPQSGKLSIVKSWELPAGEIAEPIQKLNDNLYAVVLTVHRDLGRTVLLFDIREDKPIWQTSWGVPVELAEPKMTNQSLNWVEPFGRAFEMKLNEASSQQKFEWNPGKIRESINSDDAGVQPVRWNWFDSGEYRIGLASEHRNQIQLRTSGSKESRIVTMPVETELPPLLMGEMLIIAGAGGEISVASAKDGAPMGQPFIPDYEKSSPWHWVSMVGLEDQSVVLADQTGRLVRLVLEQNPTRLRQTTKVQLEGKFAGILVSTGRAVLASLSGGSVVSLAGRDLSTQATWAFPGAGTRTFALNNTNALICHPSGLLRIIDESGQTRTEANLPNGMPFGSPILKNGVLVWLTQNKQSELILWNINESQPKRFALNTWVMGPLIPDGEGWVVVERPGIVRKIPPTAIDVSEAEAQSATIAAPTSTQAGQQ